MSDLFAFGLMVSVLYAAAWVSTKMGASSIVGFLVVGIVLGPGGLLPVFEIGTVTSFFGELGLLLLLFGLGLEFSLARFGEGGRATLVAGSLDLVHLGVGFVLGLVFGFGAWGAAFLGAAVYVSSSGVIARLLAERDLAAYPETERTLGVLVFEDLAMIVVLGGLAVATSGGGWARLVAAAVFLACYVVLLRFGRPVLERLLAREGETFVLMLLGLIVLVAVAAHAAAFPEAVAAFLLGMVVAESRAKDRVERTLAPWQQVAAAAFFFDVGLHVDVQSAWSSLGAAVVVFVVVTATQLWVGYASGRATGLSVRGSVGHAFMLVPRGEFSLVVAGLATAASNVPGPVAASLQATVSTYVVLSVAIGSVLMSNYDAWTDRVASWIPSPRGASAAVTARAADLAAMTLEAAAVDGATPDDAEGEQGDRADVGRDPGRG